MTKLRAPFTFNNAVTRVAGLIGWPEVARITGRAERTVRDWSDPAKRTVAPIDQALELDLAYRAAGGEDSPFHDAFTFLLGARRDQQEACVRQLVREVSDASTEFGQAMAACLTLVSSNVSPLNAHRALAETQEVAQCIELLLRRLASFLPSHADADAGMNGGNHQ